MSPAVIAAWLAVAGGLAQDAAAPPGREAEPPDQAAPATGVSAKAAEELSRLAEKMRAAPPLSSHERLERAASAASGLIRPLPTPVAVAATVVGFALLLFGQRLFRFGVVAYMMALLGIAGSQVGVGAGGTWAPYVGGAIGCVIGAAIALPLRAIARATIGGLAGGILAAMIIQSFTSSWYVTILATVAGIVASGTLTFYFPAPLLIVGFSIFGAAAASVGILSVATEPVNGTLSYGAPQISGMLLAAALGVLFQSQLGARDVPDDDS